jgi:PPOX class probable F420-dependent enzyme
MDLERARDFARQHHRAVMATRTPSGAVRQTPVVVAVDEEGRFTVSSREGAFKVRNLRRDPWAQLCLLTEMFFGAWMYVEGTVELVSLPEAMEPLVEYYRAISGEHEDWDDYRDAMRRDRRVLIRLVADRAGPDQQG